MSNRHNLEDASRQLTIVERERDEARAALSTERAAREKDGAYFTAKLDEAVSQANSVGRERDELWKEVKTLRSRLAESADREAVVVAMVEHQAEDEGLWFRAETDPEAYLQEQIRGLHRVIEAALTKTPLPVGEAEK